jgi:ElaB/YqjD/DUF883 family membrane-anchored ribosome-binding protein
MASKDAEMPDHRALSEDIRKITAHLARLRQELDGLAGSVGQTGVHQAEALQGQANDAVNAVADAVKRDPLTSVAIALGIGFLLGLVLRR